VKVVTDLCALAQRKTLMKRFLFILLLTTGCFIADAQIDLDAPVIDYMAYQKPLVDVLQDIAK